MQPDLGDSDEAWAQRALQDREAFGELVRRYGDKIFNLAYRMTADRSVAEDLAQEAFIRAYRGLPGYKPELPFGAWMYRIAVNVCLTERKRQGHVQEDPLDDAVAVELLDDGPSVAELVERREVRGAVQQAILSLPPLYRTVVILYHLEGRSYDEIAAILDQPINTVRTHLHRGRALLREKLSPPG